MYTTTQQPLQQNALRLLPPPPPPPRPVRALGVCFRIPRSRVSTPPDAGRGGRSARYTAKHRRARVCVRTADSRRAIYRVTPPTERFLFLVRRAHDENVRGGGTNRSNIAERFVYAVAMSSRRSFFPSSHSRVPTVLRNCRA